jgi:hypothetical protein
LCYVPIYDASNDGTKQLRTVYIRGMLSTILIRMLWFSSLYTYTYFFLWRCGPTRAMASSFVRFLYTTQRHNTVGRTPLDKWSARRRNFYLTTHNTHNRETSMPSAGFEPTIPAGERPQTHALDRAVTGTGCFIYNQINTTIMELEMGTKFLFSCVRTQSEKVGEYFAEEDTSNYKERRNNGLEQLRNENINDLILIIKPTRCTNSSNLFFGIELYIFRKIPLSIIRSLALYTRQYIQVMLTALQSA